MLVWHYSLLHEGLLFAMIMSLLKMLQLNADNTQDTGSARSQCLTSEEIVSEIFTNQTLFRATILAGFKNFRRLMVCT